MEDMVEKRKVEVNGGKRAERRFHVLESRLHADDIRVYKAASKKSKEEKVLSTFSISYTLNFHVFEQ